MPIGHLCVFFENNVCLDPLTIFNWINCFLILSCMSYFYILDINSLSDILFANIFSHSIGIIFVLLIAFFIVQKLLGLSKSHLFIFAFVSLA